MTYLIKRQQILPECKSKLKKFTKNITYTRIRVVFSRWYFCHFTILKLFLLEIYKKYIIKLERFLAVCQNFCLQALPKLLIINILH